MNGVGSYYFRERPRQTRKEYIKTWSRLNSIIFDSSYNVTDLFFEDGPSTYALISYDNPAEDIPETSMHNAVIGAHVTTYARHALLDYMEQVRGRVLYW